MNGTKTRMLKWLGTIGMLFLAVPGLAQVAPRPILIRGGTLIDGSGKGPQKDVSILIEREAIQEIGKNLSVPLNGRVINAKGKFIIPGLIDARVKLGPSPANRISHDEIEVNQQLRSLRSLVEAGVTTVRLVQGDLRDEQFYQRAWKYSLLVSPRIIASGPVFTAPNGHPSEEYGPLASESRKLQLREVALAEEAKDRAEEAIESGVEAVEVVYDAGLADHPYPRLSKEALSAIITAAHAAKLKVFCAVSTNEEAATAIQAGADVIEGVWQEALSDETASSMANKKVSYMPVLTNQGDLVNLLDPDELKKYLADPFVQKTVSTVLRDSAETPGGILDVLRKDLKDYPEARKEMEEQEKRGQQSVKRAEAEGVSVIVGTDSGNTLIFPGAAVDRELQLMVQAGLTPEQALAAATRNTADSLGMGEQIGTVEKGKQADLVILSANPLENIRNLEKIDNVIYAGHWFGQEAGAPKAAGQKPGTKPKPQPRTKMKPSR